MLLQTKMNILDLPNEILIKIILILKYIDLENIYYSCKAINKLIDANIDIIYNSLYNRDKLLYYSDYETKLYRSNLDMRALQKLYKNIIIKKKTAVYCLKCIYRWLLCELFDAPMDRFQIHPDMIECVKLSLYYIFFSKKEIIQLQMLMINNYSYRQLINIIVKYVNPTLFNNYNIKIQLHGFKINEKYDFDNPQLYLFNNDYNYKVKYTIKPYLSDTDLFYNLI